MITAQIRLHANYIKSDPLGRLSDMEISSVELQYRNVSIDTALSTAELQSFQITTMSLSNNIYSATLSLEENTVYYVRAKVTNPAGSIYCRVQFIDSSDATTYYNMQYQVQTSVSEELVPVEGATLKLIPAEGIELPKWIDGVKDDANPDTYPFPYPGTAEELYDYITDRLVLPTNVGLHIEAITGYNGHVALQRIPAGTYTLQISKTGFTTLERTITVSQNVDSGIWEIEEV